MKEKKGQVSTELLLVVGFVLLLFIPLLFIMYQQTDALIEGFSYLHAHLAVHRLAYLINSVGYMGDGSSIVLTIYLPHNVESLEVRSSDLSAGSEVMVKLSKGDSIAVPVSFKVDTSKLGDIKEGKTTLLLTHEEEKISIEKRQ
ncbi:hypothetical protein KAW38_01950 [Candidatus Micrarchaeota archaeon]|nr:hypothetical protein [Candidatus Micrarchaeota archaeon]